MTPYIHFLGVDHNAYVCSCSTPSFSVRYFPVLQLPVLQIQLSPNNHTGRLSLKSIRPCHHAAFLVSTQRFSGNQILFLNKINVVIGYITVANNNSTLHVSLASNLYTSLIRHQDSDTTKSNKIIIIRYTKCYKPSISFTVQTSHYLTQMRSN